MYDPNCELRFMDKVGTGFNREMLGKIPAMPYPLTRDTSPFRASGPEEPQPPRDAHFTKPRVVCEVRSSEFTNHGVVRHPAFSA